MKKATKRRSLSLDSQSGELSDELSNDEDDDSIDDDFEDDDDDETEEDAPSHIPSPKKNLKVNGKGKTVNSRGTGPVNGNFLAVPVTPSNKRRFSNLSTASVLDEDDGDIVTPLNFPRKKKHRTLSNNNEGLLAYSALRQRSEASEMVSEVAVESDDDDDALYQAVNLISDDEDDADVEKLEEEVIMSTEPSFGSFGGDPFLADPSSEMIYMMGPPGYFGTPDRELARLVDFPVGETERPAPKAEGTEGRKYSNGSTKRVRFWDEQSVDDDSSSTSSDLDAIFPDIFAEQDRLPPLLQKLIDNDTDIDNGQRSDSDGEHSYWDFSETDQASPSRGGFIDEDVGDDADDSTSSGYDCMRIRNPQYSFANLAMQRKVKPLMRTFLHLLQYAVPKPSCIGLRHLRVTRPQAQRNRFAERSDVATRSLALAGAISPLTPRRQLRTPTLLVPKSSSILQG